MLVILRMNRKFMEFMRERYLPTQTSPSPSCASTLAAPSSTQRQTKSDGTHALPPSRSHSRPFAPLALGQHVRISVRLPLKMLQVQSCSTEYTLDIV